MLQAFAIPVAQARVETSPPIGRQSGLLLQLHAKSRPKLGPRQIRQLASDFEQLFHLTIPRVPWGSSPHSVGDHCSDGLIQMIGCKAIHDDSSLDLSCFRWRETEAA